MNSNPILNERYQCLVKLAAFAAENDVEVSSFTQHEVLDAALNINAIKKYLFMCMPMRGFLSVF